MNVLREVLCLAFVGPSAEVQSAVEPDTQQRRHVRTSIGSNGGQPIHLGIGQLSPSLGPLELHCIPAAEGTQLGYRLLLDHLESPYLRQNQATTRGVRCRCDPSSRMSLKSYHSRPRGSLWRASAAAHTECQLPDAVPRT